MSLVFFFLTNVPISGLCLPRVGEGVEGEGEEDNAGGGSPPSMVSERGLGDHNHISPRESGVLRSNSLGGSTVSLQNGL